MRTVLDGEAVYFELSGGSPAATKPEIEGSITHLLLEHAQRRLDVARCFGPLSALEPRNRPQQQRSAAVARYEANGLGGVQVSGAQCVEKWFGELWIPALDHSTGTSVAYPCARTKLMCTPRQLESCAHSLQRRLFVE